MSQSFTAYKVFKEIVGKSTLNDSNYFYNHLAQMFNATTRLSNLGESWAWEAGIGGDILDKKVTSFCETNETPGLQKFHDFSIIISIFMDIKMADNITFYLVSMLKRIFESTKKCKAKILMLGEY